MNNIIRVFKMNLSLLVLVFFFQCEVNKNITLEEDLSKTLISWNLKADVSITEIDSVMQINIYYKKNINSTNQDSYYYDVYSNELIIKAIVKKFKERFKDFQQLNFKIEFEGAPDIANFYLDYNKRKNIYNFFQDELFYNSVIYSLENFNYDDITLINSAIKKITNGSKVFNFEVYNYWELLEIYTNFNTKPTKKSLKKVELFIITIGAFNKNFKKHANPNIDKKLNILLTMSNVEIQVLNMKFIEIEEYLIKRFDL